MEADNEKRGFYGLGVIAAEHNSTPSLHHSKTDVHEADVTSGSMVSSYLF